MTSKMRDVTLIKYLIQANQFRHKKNYQQAIAVYAELIKQFGETVDLARAIAYCYFNLGFYENQERERNFQLAIDWAKKAIGLAPNNGQLHVDLGDFYALGTLDYSSAILEYKTAIELDPNNTRALMGAASLYGLPDDVVTLNETITWLDTATRLEPNNPLPHFRLGMFLLDSSQYENAKREFIATLLCPIPLDAGLAETIKNKIET